MKYDDSDPVTVDMGSWVLRGVQRGEGSPPVVLVHGWTCDRTVMEPLFTALSETNRCVAIDLRGHGASGAPAASSWRIEDLARDLAAVVDALGLGPVALIGHSTGGTIAYELAVQNRQHVAGLVLLHPMPLRHTDDSRTRFASVLGALRDRESHTAIRQAVIDSAMFTEETDPELRAALCELMIDASPDSATSCWEALVEYDACHGPLGDLPALVISGAGTANDDNQISELLPRAVIEHLRTGSFVHLEEPDRVAQRCIEFVEHLAALGDSVRVPPEATPLGALRVARNSEDADAAR